MQRDMVMAMANEDPTGIVNLVQDFANHYGSERIDSPRVALVFLRVAIFHL